MEDCRHLSRRLERDLLAAGQQVARVPPKLMAHARTAARTYGKSDPIDALAVARAALREPDLPAARLDGPARELQLLVDHRDDLVAERTRVINRLRWHLHELDPAVTPPARSLSRAPATHLAAVEAFLGRLDSDGNQVVAQLAGQLVARVRELNARSTSSRRTWRRGCGAAPRRCWRFVAAARSRPPSLSRREAAECG